MSGFTLMAMAAVWVFVATNSFGQPRQPSNTDATLSEAELRKIFANNCDHANAFYKEEHFPILVPNPNRCEFSFQLNQGYKEPTGIFVPEEEALVGGEILAKSGKTIRFRNEAASQAFEHLPLQETPPKARWSEAQAVEVATKFATFFLRSWGSVSLGKPYAQHANQGRDVDSATGKLKTGPVIWTISWGEQTPSGIPYLSGELIVSLSEEYGPDAIYLNFVPQYVDEHVTPMPEGRALVAARKGLDQVLAWSPCKAGLGNVHLQDTPPLIQLFVVQPNHLTQHKSMAEAAFASEVKARLAWVVKYRVSASSGDGNGTITVYIDARDGSLLGGYF